MSLLLDALKKAAADKERSAQADKLPSDEISIKDQTPDAVESEKNTGAAAKPILADSDETVPEVDESAFELQTDEKTKPETETEVATIEEEYLDLELIDDLDVSTKPEKKTQVAAENEIVKLDDEKITAEIIDEKNAFLEEPIEKNSSHKTDKKTLGDDALASESSAQKKTDTSATETNDKPVEKTVSIESIVEGETEASEPVKKVFDPKSEHPDYPLPAYDREDARKILAISQKKFRNNHRIFIYGMYVLAALLFFTLIYFYYSAEILDNSNEKLFSSKRSASAAINNERNRQPNNERNRQPNNVAKPVRQAEPVKELQKPELLTAVDSKSTTAQSTSSKDKSTQVPGEVIAREKNKSVAKEQKKIIISKKKKRDSIAILLSKAYKLYNQGQYDQADSLYQQVIVRDIRQRDALLGRAAIALIKHDYDAARDYYKRIQYYYPNDTIATSAMVDLSKKEFDIADESTIKSMLRDSPEAAHLHFSLGLLYARQNQYEQSQQAFFDAYTRQKNPDYAYNLAIALEKIDQPSAAINYYKQAVELAKVHAYNFKIEAIHKRIAHLGNNNE